MSAYRRQPRVGEKNPWFAAVSASNSNERNGAFGEDQVLQFILARRNIFIHAAIVRYPVLSAILCRAQQKTGHLTTSGLENCGMTQEMIQSRAFVVQ